jgi:hypothetical protein
MGEGREVARGAHRAALGNHGVQARIHEGEQPLDEFDLRPGIVGREGVGAQQHHGPRGVLAEGFADAGRVRIDGLALIGSISAISTR